MEKQLNVFLKYVDLLSKTNKKILSKIVSDYKVQILQIPSLDKEYNFKGGFLKQLCSSLNLYSKIHSIYSFKYEDIIIGIMLKNIGLVKYFNNDIVFSISERNKSIGTQVLGIKIIDKYFIQGDEGIVDFIHNLVISDISSNDPMIKCVNCLYEFDCTMDNLQI